MRVRFYVEKRRGSDGKVLEARRPIFMTVAFHGKRVLFSTGKFVDLKWWDYEEQRVQEAHPDAHLINVWLETLVYTASVVWKTLAILSEKPGAGDFRREFERLKPRFSGGFFEILFLFMKEGMDHWSATTYRKVRYFYDQLRAFVAETGYLMRFDRMNEDFLHQFRSFNLARGLSEMSIKKSVNTLVWFLNWASENGYNIHDEYKQFYKMLTKVYRPPNRKPIYLEWEELMKLLRHEADSFRNDRIRDLFCLMCFTGIRYGELKTLEREDVRENSLFIKGRGGRERTIPINEFAKKILVKYRMKYYRDNLALPVVSMATFNKYLRILGKEVKLDRMVKNPGDGMHEKPLYEFLTAGIAGKTFIMNALRLDIPSGIISTFTGVAVDQRINIMQQEIAKAQIVKFDQIQPKQ